MSDVKLLEFADSLNMWCEVGGGGKEFNHFKVSGPSSGDRIVINELEELQMERFWGEYQEFSLGYVNTKISVRCLREDIEEAAEYLSLWGRESLLAVYPRNSGEAEHANIHYLDTGRL